MTEAGRVVPLSIVTKIAVLGVWVVVEALCNLYVILMSSGEELHL